MSLYQRSTIKLDLEIAKCVGLFGRPSVSFLNISFSFCVSVFFKQFSFGFILLPLFSSNSSTDQTVPAIQTKICFKNVQHLSDSYNMV